jgi:hypothetical protein
MNRRASKGFIGMALILVCMLILLVCSTVEASQVAPTVSGTATLTFNKSKKTLTVVIKMNGLVAGSIHADHIHNGLCNPGTGTIHKGLTKIKGDKKTTTVLQNILSIPDNKWSINVHFGSNIAIPAQKVVIACGDILNPNNSNKVTVKLVPPPV